ncbi:hypothetical protein E4U21_002062 [Claviceps maximensis]|nr:hypothetical protein E4U21_002062 [Claviceps maximensis]
MQSATGLILRSVAQRSIRVLVSPTPVTFAQRRSVLQVLEQYGPVEVFQMAPDKRSNFISVTREETTAKKLVDCSPLVYRMPAPSKPTNLNIADLMAGDSSNAFNTDSNGPSVVNSSQEDSAANDDDFGPTAFGSRFSSASEQQPAQFKLDIFPAPEYLHEFAMTRSPLHQSWPTTYDKNISHTTSILKQSLPQTMVSEGLAYWLMGSDCINSNRPHGSKFARTQVIRWTPSKMNKPYEK